MKKIFNLLFILLMITTSCKQTDSSNPFFKEFDTPHATAPFDKIKNEHYMPAIDKGIALQQAEIDAIVANTEAPTFKNTLVALEQSGEMLNRVTAIFFALLSAQSDDEMMVISEGISQKLSDHSNNINLNAKLFERIKAVYLQRDSLHLNDEEMMLLKETYEGFERNGANLKGEERDRYRALSTELSQLTLQFGQNALKATNQFEMYLTEAELDGLPQSAKEEAKALATEKGKEGYLVNLSAPSYLAFMQYANRRDLREKLYRGYNSRCISGEFSNVENIIRIAQLRLEIAQLIGKETYADLSLEDTMAKTPANVYNLLNELLVAYKPAALKDVQAVQAFAHKKEGKSIQIMPWDWSYYSEKLKDEKYTLNDEMLKPYFELENVKKGVFGLAKTLYGLKFVPNKAIPVYHPDVEAFEVFDANDRFLSVLYTDFHPRKEKRSGGWMTEYKGQSKKDGKDSRPQITIVMNFTKPTATTPALLTFNEVETFLHEFGHALHGMLAEGTYESLSGTNVYRDFVELPSQFMENFLSEKEFLDKFAIHYQKGTPMPQEYIDRIKEASTYNAAYSCIRQLNFALLDMAWHTQKEKVTDAFAFERKATEATQILPVVDNVLTGATFSHIFSGGYAAGYYSYKWAEVLDADAFAYFKENGLFNPTIAKSFRTNILEQGGSKDPMELYIQFRGTAPTIDALKQRDGIK